LLFKKNKRKENLKNLRILAVDDSYEVLEYFNCFAKSKRLHCEVAANGAEAYKIIEVGLLADKGKLPFDVIFVDWCMPEMDGIELTKKIKQLGSEVVIIMISATEWKGIEEQAKDAGVDGFIQKPLFPSALVDCITQYVNTGERDTAEIQHEASNENIFEGKTILLAEDVEINQEIVIGLLEGTGISIDCVGNGLEAIKMFQENSEKYDLVLMDIHMPEMDGFDATRHIRHLELDKANTTPIMAMTANVFREDVEKCFACGMNDHIGKPLDFEELMKKLKKYLMQNNRGSSKMSDFGTATLDVLDNIVISE
jgi:CheY-like chemotaxis protein